LAQYVNATETQRLQLKAKAIDMTKAMQEFMKANGPAWQQATADCAGSPDDPDKRKAAGEKVAQFQAQWDQLLAAHQAAVMNVLTPDQRLAWEEHCLTEAMTARVAGMQIRHDAGGQPVAQRGELTPRQTKMIEDACKATAKTIQGMTDPYDPARRQELITKLEADIRQKLQPAGIAPTTQPEGK
jgi:Spy/CpxP family protein refolding chaperone